MLALVHYRIRKTALSTITKMPKGQRTWALPKALLSYRGQKHCRGGPFPPHGNPTPAGSPCVILQETWQRGRTGDQHVKKRDSSSEAHLWMGKHGGNRMETKSKPSDTPSRLRPSEQREAG